MSKYFRDSKTPALRAWNQVNQAVNLSKEFGDEKAASYFDGLSSAEQGNFRVVATRITCKGKDFVKAEVMRG